MSVTPGQAGKMNSLVGYARIVPVTNDEFTTTMKDKIFKAGTMLLKADGKVLIADGTTKLSELAVRIDQTLVKVEKDALTAAFGTGAYARAAGGVVVHDENGTIDDASLKVVSDGKIVRSYLSEVVDGNGKVLDSVLNMVQDSKIVRSYLSDFLDADGMIKLSALPETVRAGVAYFPNYAAMNSSTNPEHKIGACFVIDATDDPSKSVKTGSAMYVWDKTAKSGAGDWIKIAEVESLDVDVTSFFTPEIIAQQGAVMYDQPVVLGGMTLTELATLESI